MGAKQTKQKIKNDLKTTIINETIQNFINENSQKVSASSLAGQNVKFKAGNLKGCNFDVIQKMDVQVQSTGELNTNSLSDLKKEVKNKLDEKLKNELKNKSGFMNLEVGTSKQELETKMAKHIENKLNQTITNKNYAEILASSVAIQGTDITLGDIDCTSGGDIKINQDLAARVIAENLSELIVDNLVDDTFDNDLKTKVDQSLLAESFGPLESLKALFSGQSGIVMIFVILFIIIMIALVAYVRSGGGRKGRGGGGGGGGNPINDENIKLILEKLKSS